MPARSDWVGYSDDLVRQLCGGRNEVYQSIAEIKAGGRCPRDEAWVASEWDKAVKGATDYDTAAKRGLLLHPHYAADGKLDAITFSLRQRDPAEVVAGWIRDGV